MLQPAQQPAPKVYHPLGPNSSLNLKPESDILLTLGNQVVKVGKIINYLALHSPIMLKFVAVVRYRSPGTARLWKSTSGQIQDGGRHPNWT